MKNSFRKYMWWFSVAVFAFFLLWFGWLSIQHIGAPSHGQHTGYVTAVEQEGLIWKTWRAYVKTDPQSSQEDMYCVTDPAVLAQVQTIERERQLVTLYYSSPIIVFKWQCNFDGAIIRSISPSTGVTPTS